MSRELYSKALIVLLTAEEKRKEERRRKKENAIIAMVSAIKNVLTVLAVAIRNLLLS